MNNDMKAGIKSCYYTNHKKREYLLMKPNSIIYLLAGNTHEFFVADDDHILGANTKNRKETLNKTKWAFLLSYYWNEAQKTEKGSELPLWANLSGGEETVAEFGIAKRYEQGKSIILSPIPDDIWLGYFYRMEVFSFTPGMGMNLDFMIIDKPKIRLGYFDKQILKPVLKDFSIDDGYYSYGEVITLYIDTHLLPVKINEDKVYGYFSEKFSFEQENSFKDLEIKIYLTDENGKKLLEKPILTGDLENYLAHEYSVSSNNIKVTAANLGFEIPILIDPKWKDSIHHSKDKTKNYSVFISIENKETEKKYEYTPDITKLVRVAKSNRDFEKKEIDSKFSVKYESMDTILTNQEIKKNNMIQYIGDVQYNHQEHNPCAYSVITVNNGEKDFEIFNEFMLNKKVNDQTSRFIDIVAGDKETKEVKITAKFKKNKDAPPEAVRTHKNKHKCEKILNDGKYHEGIHDVFKMGWIVGQWVPSKDPRLFATRYMKKLGLGGKGGFFHPSNGSKSTKLEWDKPDQDAKGIESPLKQDFEIVTVAGVQGLNDEDYTINEEDDSITLKLQYKYNKQYDDQVLNYLYGDQTYLKGGMFSDNIKNVWVVRYLLKWIKKEPLEQIYFVPVSTCRYPNQIAQIRLFPDMKWVLNFNYNIETPLYYKANTALTEYYSGFNEGKITEGGKERDIVTSNNNRRKEILGKSITNDLKHFAGRKTSFGLSVDCEVSGDGVINLGDEFAEKYRQMLKPIFLLINKLDGDLGISDAKDKQTELITSPSTKKGLFDRLTNSRFPMEFELKPPSLGAGIGIGYGASQKGTMSYELEGRIQANPIIGASVKLDILALGSKLKPWGAIIDALDLASWAANLFSGGSIEINYELYFQLTAEIRLVGTDSKEGEAKPANIKYNFADKKYEGDIGLQGYLEGKLFASFAISLEIEMSKGKKFNGDINQKAESKKAELNIGAEGKSYVALTKCKNFGNENNWDADFYFSGLNLKVWAKFGLSDGEPKEFDIIPYVEGKLDILKGKFEIK